jgi:hypothetical protein
MAVQGPQRKQKLPRKEGELLLIFHPFKGGALGWLLIQGRELLMRYPNSPIHGLRLPTSFPYMSSP